MDSAAAVEVAVVAEVHYLSLLVVFVIADIEKDGPVATTLQSATAAGRPGWKSAHTNRSSVSFLCCLTEGEFGTFMLDFIRRFHICIKDCIFRRICRASPCVDDAFFPRILKSFSYRKALRRAPAGGYLLCILKASNSIDCVFAGLL